MPHRISWLHLTDLHRGAPGEDARWPVLRDKLLEDLREQAGQRGSPDLILFTGDLAFSGASRDKNEYRSVDEDLQRICDAVGGRPILVPVPGNHDLERPGRGDTLTTSLESYLEREETRAAFCKREPAVVGQVRRPFTAYESWWRERVRGEWTAHGLPFDEGLLPGDFALTVERNGWKLGLLGLNSAWLHLAADEDTPGGRGFRGRLAVESEQIAAGLAVPDWARKHDAALLLMHHPLAWLNDTRQDDFKGRIYDPQWFAACLYGHMHQADTERITTSDGLTRVWIQGRSLCGLENYAKHNESYPSGYAWGALERRDDGSGRLTVEPRAAVKQSDGRIVVKADPALSSLEHAIALHARASSSGARIAVIGVDEEFAEFLESLVKRLRRMHGVDEAVRIDARAACGEQAFEEFHLCLVVVGLIAVDGSVLSAATLQGRARIGVAPPSTIDPFTRDPVEFAAARAARERVGDAITARTADDALERTHERVSDWLQARRATAPADRPGPHAWERAYLRARLPLWEDGPSSTLASVAGKHTLTRAKQYVSLCAQVDWCAERKGELVRDDELSGDATWNARKGVLATPGDESQSELEPARLERALSLADVRHLVIEGEAGSGKTVLLQHVAYVLALDHLALELPEHHLDLAALAHGAPLTPIPILFGASALAAACSEAEPGHSPGIEALVRAIATEIKTATGAAPDERIVKEGVDAGRYLVLIDAHDEVTGESGRIAVSTVLACGASSRAKSRILLTTRPTAHTGVALPGEPFRLLRVAPLAPQAARAIVDRWCAMNGVGWQDAFFGALEELTQRGGASNLAENPQQLVVAMLVYAEAERLPDSLAELYEKLVRILCDGRATPGRNADAKRQALELVFRRAQEHGTTEPLVDDAANWLIEGKHVSPSEGVSAARELLDRISQDTGLIYFEDRKQEGQPPARVVRPWHRSFQEFLAARFAVQSTSDVGAQADELFVQAARTGTAPIHDPAWTNTLRFLAGVLGAQSRAHAQGYVARLRVRALGLDGCAREERKGRVLALVAAALAEYRHLFDGHELLAKVPGEVAAEFERHGSTWPVDARILALDAIGRLGDPRIDGDPWVVIPPGPYAIGGDKNAYSALPARTIEIRDLRVCWRPAVVADYARFLEDRSRDDDAWWADAPDDVRAASDRALPHGWLAQRRHRTRPIVGVSYWQALAFARWADRRMREEWDVADGWSVDLPTELEWEAIARHTSKGPFPWGADEPGVGDAARANHSSERAHATPVGAFPLGNCGRIVDLAGNVWEWTKSPWSTARNASPEHQRSVARVVRGGSWWSEPRNLRCATRGRNVPASRPGLLGFRVVCRRSPEHVD